MTSGVEPETSKGAEDEESDVSLLKLKPKAAARRIFREFERQAPLVKPRHEQWRVNNLRRLGFTNIVLRKDEDTGQWAAYAPPDAVPNPIALNKAERLCERLAATMFVDPPVPDCPPASDTDEDRDAAEFSTRLLILNGAEAGLNTPLKAQQALDLGSTYDSGFVRYWVDPAGNGSRPMEVLAHPQASTLELATRDPQGTPYPTSQLVRRYVKDDRTTLTDNEAEAGRQNLPKLRSEVLNGLHVRFLPSSARDIWEAEGVLVASLVPLGRLRAAFAEQFVALDKEQLKKLVSARPEGAEKLLPAAARQRYKTDLEKGRVTDDSLIFTITFQHLPSSLYPQGAYIVVAGNEKTGKDDDDTAYEDGSCLVLEQKPWVNPRTKKPLRLALSQFKQWDLEDDSWGLGAMGKLGPGNEARSYLQGAMFEQTDRQIHRKVFLPHTSTLQPKSMQAQFGTYIYVNPTGHPEYEKVDPLAPAVTELHQAITAEMDDEVSLQPSAQGINPASVQSDVHARTLIEQSNVGLGGIRTNTLRGIIRCWEIELELCQAFFDPPQKVSWLTDEGVYKERHWSSADLGSTKDVQLAKGSFTQLAPSQKAQLAKELHGAGMLPPDELERILAANVGGTLALQDNPLRLRIRRQLSDWTDGPPPELQEQIPAWQKVMQEGAAAIAAGQVAPPPHPVTAYAQQIFGPLPLDEEQDVAQVRHREMRRVMASTKYLRWPPEWRQPFDAEYQRMRLAAGVYTLAEQQKMQADAAAQQAAAAQRAAQEKSAALDAQRGDKGADREARQAAAEADRDLKREAMDRREAPALV